MHESYDQQDAGVFTRTWFAWANSLLGEAVLHIMDTRPYLLFGVRGVGT